MAILLHTFFFPEVDLGGSEQLKKVYRLLLREDNDDLGEVPGVGAYPDGARIFMAVSKDSK